MAMTSPTTFSLPDKVFRSTNFPLALACNLAGVALSNAWTTDEFFRIWSAAETLLDSPDAGLRFGAHGIDRGYGIASIVALHAPDFRGALKTLSRYKRLTCPELVEVQSVGSETTVHYRWLAAMDAIPRLLVDTTMASLAALALRGTGDQVRPLRLELARRPALHTLLSEHFGCEIRFGAEHDVMVFETSTLDVPFVTANSGTFADVLQAMEGQLDARDGHAALALEVRTAIARQLSEGRETTVSAVSRRLNLSIRTLQRRLGETRTSFQAELAGARHVIANRLLANTQLDPVAIAMMIGFVEPNSFVRAYRNWENTTPQQWRRQHGANQA
ncbi:MAG: AraC family transcriptional regulator ligand-binding domain-containing protein [Candidatus Devosia phytovorans]|uniref:AraC family transcriptional regulator ligand-binding domain-containing protein n=1 Tax=Candidatus Devosia phytovorans TaxID=3121372 RepID=A0AAJ6AYI8_9HYPH|nr:AraC family transcriptional regulator [Devosia sp.]WEK02977.1 MAG: AraC family transcriptional regulator ligand-binding domain-containing protein [Devosia sp.]